MLIAALFMISPNWKQLECPSTGECTDKGWYIHTMGFYSAIKMGERLTHLTWGNVKIIRLNEQSPTKKEYTLFSSTYINSRTCKLLYNSRKQVYPGTGWKTDGVPRGVRKLWGVTGMSATLIVVMVSWEHLHKDVKEKRGRKKEITKPTNELNQILRETVTPMLFKTSQGTEQKGTLPNSFYETRITLIPKPGENSTFMKSMMLCTYLCSYH